MCLDSDADEDTDNEDGDMDIVADLSDSYQAVVNKVRKIVTIFKQLPTKQEAQHLLRQGEMLM